MVLFQDDFQDGDAQDWTISSSWTVQQADQVYVFSAAGLGGAWLPRGGAWQDYLFRAGVRVNAGMLSMSINVSQAGRYVLTMSADGLLLIKEYPAGIYSLLAQTGPFVLTEPHAVALAGQDGRLQVYVDRVLWMDVTDGAPLGPGTAGFGAQDGSQVIVDNVLVMGLSTALPGGTVQAPPPLSAEPPAELIAPADDGGLSLAQVEVEPEDIPVPPQESSNGQVDLVLENISIQPSEPEQGQPLVVAVTVRNGGDAQAGAFNLRWMPEGANFVGCSWDIFGLPPGESVDMICDYPGYPEAGTYNWGVTADADDEVAESDEGNNRRSGDVTVLPGLVQSIPPAPVGCTIAGWSMDSVTLAWEFPGDPEAIEGFGIYQGVTSLEMWTGPASREATIGGLEQGVQYHFDVRAHNAAGESDADVCSVDVTPAQ